MQNIQTRSTLFSLPPSALSGIANFTVILKKGRATILFSQPIYDKYLKMYVINVIFLDLHNSKFDFVPKSTNLIILYVNCHTISIDNFSPYMSLKSLYICMFFSSAENREFEINFWVAQVHINLKAQQHKLLIILRLCKVSNKSVKSDSSTACKCVCMIFGYFSIFSILLADAVSLQMDGLDMGQTNDHRLP